MSESDFSIDMNEAIAWYVAERFQHPPRVQIVTREADFQTFTGVHSPHAIRITVLIRTHFGLILKAEVLHGWALTPTPDIGAVLSSVATAIDYALSKQQEGGIEGFQSEYLTNPGDWSLLEPPPYHYGIGPDGQILWSPDGEFPYQPPDSWPELESPQGEEDGNDS